MRYPRYRVDTAGPPHKEISIMSDILYLTTDESKQPPTTAVPLAFGTGTYQVERLFCSRIHAAIAFERNQAPAPPQITDCPNLYHTFCQLTAACHRCLFMEPDHPQWNIIRQLLSPGLPLSHDPPVAESDLGMICRTSVSYAQRYLKQASLSTLQAALDIEKHSRNRKTLIKAIERQIAKRTKA